MKLFDQPLRCVGCGASMVLHVWNPPEGVQHSPDVQVFHGFHCGTPAAIHDVIYGPDPSIVNTPLGEWRCRFCTERKQRWDHVDQLPACPGCHGPWDRRDFTYESGEMSRVLSCQCGVFAEWYVSRGWGWYQGREAVLENAPAGAAPAEQTPTCWYCWSTADFTVKRKRSGETVRRCLSCWKRQVD